MTRYHHHPLNYMVEHPEGDYVLYNDATKRTSEIAKEYADSRVLMVRATLRCADARIKGENRKADKYAAMAFRHFQIVLVHEKAFDEWTA